MLSVEQMFLIPTLPLCQLCVGRLPLPKRTFSISTCPLCYLSEPWLVCVDALGALDFDALAVQTACWSPSQPALNYIGVVRRPGLASSRACSSSRASSGPRASRAGPLLVLGSLGSLDCSRSLYHTK